MRTKLRIAAVLAPALFACSGDGSPGEVAGAAIEPGGPVMVAGEALAPGATRAELEATLGAPERVRELGGSLGVRLSYPAHGLGVLVDGAGADARVGALYLHAVYPGRTADALGPGSSRADVEAVFGAPAHEPFLEADVSRYPREGIAFEWEGDTAATVVVFAP